MTALTRSVARVIALVALCLLSWTAWELIGIWATIVGSLLVLALVLGARLRSSRCTAPPQLLSSSR